MTTVHQILSDGLEALQVEASEFQMQQLLDYLALLERWNRKINLTGLREPALRVSRLVLEPIWVAHQLTPRGRYMDIGSGNGSPAVPWAIFSPFASTSMIEARHRRAAFLDATVRKLRLSAVRVYSVRFEAALEELPPPDWVTLQGVGLDGGLLRGIRQLNPAARIVWLTSNAAVPEPPLMRLQIPDTPREAIVFGPSERTPSGTD